MKRSSDERDWGVVLFEFHIRVLHLIFIVNVIPLILFTSIVNPITQMGFLKTKVIENM